MRKIYIKPAIRIPEFEMEYLLVSPSGTIPNNAIPTDEPPTTGSKSLFDLDYSYPEGIADKVNKNGNDLTWGEDY